MAERIYDTGKGFTPTRREFTSPLAIPSMQSPALKDLVDAQVSNYDEKTKTAQKNLAAFDTIQDSITGAEFRSEANKSKYEDILSRRYGLSEDALGKFTAQDFTNPAKISQLNNQLDKAINDPDVKRLVESEISAEEFYRNAQRIQDPDLHKKAMEDFTNALKEGERSMYGLEVDNYEPINLRDETHKAVTNLPYEQKKVEVQGEDGRFYEETIRERDPSAIKKELKFLYDSDPKFRNNFNAKMEGSAYDNFDEYADFVAQKYSKVPAGTKKEITPKTYTYDDFKSSATSEQEDALEYYLGKKGLDFSAPANEEVINKIKETVSNLEFKDYSTKEQKEAKIKDAVDEIIAGEDTDTETPEPAEEKIEISEDAIPVNGVKQKEYSLSQIQNYATKEEETMESFPIMDLSHKMGDGGEKEFNKAFGKGAYESMLGVMEDDTNRYKGELDKEDGTVRTANARWVYEEYFGKDQERGVNDPQELKNLVEQDPNIEFVPKKQGRPAHFKVNVGGTKKEDLEATELIEAGNLEPQLAEIFIDTSETNDEQAQQAGFDSAYDAPYAYGKYVDLEEGTKLTELTLDEVIDLQRQQIENTKPLVDVGGGTDKGTGAMGRYQITKGTLESLMKELNLDGDEVFNKELQDKMFRKLLERRGLNEYMEGELSVDEFIRQLSEEWEGVKNLDRAEVKKKLEAIKAGQREVELENNPTDTLDLDFYLK